MKFKTEEEIDEWFANEKERLETEFLKYINKDKENIPKYREKYEAEMKRLLAKYDEGCNRIIDRTDFSKKEE